MIARGMIYLSGLLEKNRNESLQVVITVGIGNPLPIFFSARHFPTRQNRRLPAATTNTKSRVELKRRRTTNKSGKNMVGMGSQKSLKDFV